MTRVVVDLQSVQADLASERVPRSPLLAVADALIDHPGFDCLLLLSDRFIAAAEDLRGRFDGRLAQERIHTVSLPPGIRGNDGTPAVLYAAELIREQFLSRLGVDLVVTGGVSAAWDDEVVVSYRALPTMPPSLVLADDLATLCAGSRDPREREWGVGQIEGLADAAVVCQDETLAQQLTRLAGPHRLEVTVVGPFGDRGDLEPTGSSASLSDESGALGGLLRAIEQGAAHGRRRGTQAPSGGSASRPRLAMVSPYPPAETGVADYVAELAPALETFYEVELVAPSGSTRGRTADGRYPLRDPDWFAAHADRYDRVLYQVGNSPFHAYQLGLLERVPGVVVLHDVGLTGLSGHLQSEGRQEHALDLAIYRSHGFAGLHRWARDHERAAAELPASLAIIEAAVGVIVHSDHAKALAEAAFGADVARDWAVIPHLRRPPELSEDRRRSARRALGIHDEEILCASFGHIGPTKGTELVVRAASTLSTELKARLRLVLVGALPGGPYGDLLRQELVSARSLGLHLDTPGRVDRATYERYLAACDIAVQLRLQSRGETSGTALDTLSWAVPTIINDCGSFATWPTSVAYRLPPEPDAATLATALAELAEDQDLRSRLSQAGRAWLVTSAAPELVAKRYDEFISRSWEHAQPAMTGTLLRRLARATEEGKGFTPEAKLDTSRALAANERSVTRQLLVDVSAMAHEDLGTGIQRTTRAILFSLFGRHDLAPFRVEPVRMDGGQLRYARHYAGRLLGLQTAWMREAACLIRSGDVFLGLDWAPDYLPSLVPGLQRMRTIGARAVFVLHDFLALQHPEWFPVFAKEKTEAWLQSLSVVSDGIVCVSRSVAAELYAWLEKHGARRNRRLLIGWCSNGADFERMPRAHSGKNLGWLGPPAPLSVGAGPDPEALPAEPLVLMVGTVEPRKGHAQALAAFEELWASGEEINLGIVGQAGWMTQDLAKAIAEHPMLGHRLFWWQGVSDRILASLYRRASCVLMASRAEGFGLPIVEAARFRTPVIARDIAVFREVTGGAATFFSGDEPQAIAGVVRRYFGKTASGHLPSADGIPWQSWEESAATLFAMAIDPTHPNWIMSWP